MPDTTLVQTTKPFDWEDSTTGSILILGAAPERGFSDPRCHPRAEFHPCVLLKKFDGNKKQGSFYAVMTFTSFKQPGHEAHEIHIDRLRQRWAFPCRHAGAPDLGLPLLELESRRAVKIEPSSDDDETEDSDLAIFLAWRPDAMLRASILQPFRMYLLHESELRTFVELGRRFRIAPASMPLIWNALKMSPFNTFVARIKELAAATIPYSRAALEQVDIKYSELYARLSRKFSHDKARLARQSEAFPIFTLGVAAISAAAPLQILPDCSDRPAAFMPISVALSDPTDAHRPLSGPNAPADSNQGTKSTRAFPLLYSLALKTAPRMQMIAPSASNTRSNFCSSRGMVGIAVAAPAVSRRSAAAVVKTDQSDEQWEVQCRAIDTARMEGVPSILIQGIRCGVHAKAKACGCMWAAMEEKTVGKEIWSKLRKLEAWTR